MMTDSGFTAAADIHRPTALRTRWKAQFEWEGTRLMQMLGPVRGSSVPLEVLAYVSESPEVRETLRATVRDLLPGSLNVRVRSAYKAGYFWLTEEVRPVWQRTQADRVVVWVPPGPPGSAGRFLQELYPAAALFEREGIEGVFEQGSGPAYVAALYRQGVQVWQSECAVPVQPRLSLDGREVLTPTGWLTVRDGAHTLIDERLPTDADLFWEWYCAQVIPRVLELADERPGLPVFRSLSVIAQLSEPDLGLDVLSERVSMTEALAEEVYFGTVDALKHHLGAAANSRTLMSGSIAPVVVAASNLNGWATVTLSEWGDVEFPPAVDPATTLAQVAGEPASDFLKINGPPPPVQTWRAARAQAEKHRAEWHIPATSVEGRPIPAVVGSGSSRAGGVLLTGGQHANETTGPVAAVQFIGALAAAPVPFAVLPLENPDGASLHRALIRFNPAHMHHAARYTSLGDDLELRLRVGDRRWEAAGRQWAAQTVGATLHLNLHGYPAHEWVRPYSGYAPFGFESWALPAGFMTIVWFHPGYAPAARELADAIARRLVQHPDLVEQTGRACRAGAAHSLKPHYELIRGLPFILAEHPGALCPITVITEAPDETIYGEEFRMFVRAHLTVCEAALAHHLAHPAPASSPTSSG
ncbi:zinc carboxypeptidase (plasmid) [Deinococcus sp. KNUC1210]|uniref:M14 family zinc carboxypeptidase n=1 Tax=Deinococcus sp. KNUC1210 TaxID=2917691 RepID=UPI001EF0271F|nr:M14 family zinc carboxypeptidase [Deinococcus sp. KNUC1210]ULH17052.1 zinc carboxypeptidase [Deinococcus sp. KNUC1210]